MSLKLFLNYSYLWLNVFKSISQSLVVTLGPSLSMIAGLLGGLLGFIAPVSVYVDNEVNDVPPPTGVISNPVSGQTVSGTVNFTVTAQDDQGIAEVELSIDGVVVALDTEDPYQYSWDTTGLTNDSQHTLSATVTDDAGHTTILQPVLVTVSN